MHRLVRRPLLERKILLEEEITLMATATTKSPARGNLNKYGVREKSLWTRVRENWQLYVFLIIPLAWLFIFQYYPMYGTQISFREYKIAYGIINSEWKGLTHMIRFFKSYFCWELIGNTFFLSIYSMVASYPIPIVFALCLNAIRNKTWKGWIENVTYMPHFISTVVMVGIMLQILNMRTGVVASVYCLFTGAKTFPVDLLAGGWNFRHVYVWSGIWQGTGWGSIIYMAALSSVDPGLHEAATIDGASRWKRVWAIDFPTILPTIAVTLILRCGSVMGIGFDKAFLLQNDTNTGMSEVISTYTYKIGLASSGKSQYSYASAIGLCNSLVNLVMITTVNKIANKVSGSGLW